jgi:hypothetical protein
MSDRVGSGDPADPAMGEAILDVALTRANEMFGPRLEAAYALGSLAHGGFSSLVSDVDLGLILVDPLTAPDANRIAEITSQVSATGVPLADRLSVFWGSRSSLGSPAAGDTPGRFPPLDRLDLRRYGRLLHGAEVRDGVLEPTHQELVMAAARLCLSQVARYPLAAWVQDPGRLLAEGPRSATKPVLFPVRFLYTARTGEIGRNHDAVAHLVTHYPGAAADLAAAALYWREAPAPPTDAQAIALLRDGLIPLYRSCLQVHRDFARSWGEDGLAEELAKAHDELQAG